MQSKKLKKKKATTKKPKQKTKNLNIFYPEVQFSGIYILWMIL